MFDLDTVRYVAGEALATVGLILALASIVGGFIAVG
jgi:hypothetical protein